MNYPRYPKSRLPGPAVKLFDLGALVDDETTVRRASHDDTTLTSPPEVEWVLLHDCRRD